MKAVVLTELNRPLKIKELEIPPLVDGQVLVKVAYSGLCRSQLMEVLGKRGKDRYLPHLLGHEGSGIVMQVSPGVEKVKKGDRVVLGWIKGDGAEVPCSHYKCGIETINSGAVTTFSDYSLVSENRLVKLPDDVPLKVGVLFGCAIPTGSGIIINELKPHAGSSIVVLGLGGIGLSALMALNLFECSKIIAIDIENDKLQLAKELGAHVVLNMQDGDCLEKVIKLTGGGADYTVEATGLTKNIECAFQMVRKNGGQCIFASHPQSGEKIKLDPHDLISGKMIRGSWGGQCYPDRDLPRLFDLYRKGHLPVDKLLSKSYRLDEINQAFEDLQERRVIRALLAIAPELEE